MPMTSYCQARVTGCLEKVIQHGAVVISATELKMWFNAQRLTKTVWRDILDLWNELVENTKYVKQSPEEAPILVADNTEDNASFTFVWGEGLMVTGDSWFKKLESWT